MALLPIGSVGPTFQELLFIYISRLNTGDPEIYHRAQISRATFSNIRSGKKGVSKKTLKHLNWCITKAHKMRWKDLIRGLV